MVWISTDISVLDQVPETDIVTPDQIAEVVARWTAIPAQRLMSTEKQVSVLSQSHYLSFCSPRRSSFELWLCGPSETSSNGKNSQQDACRSA